MAIFSPSRLADSGAGRGWWLFKLLLRLLATALGLAGILCFGVYYGLNSAWHRSAYYHFQNDITMGFIPLACSILWNSITIILFLLPRRNRPMPLVLIFVDFLIFAGFTCADAWAFRKLDYVNGVVSGSAADPKYGYIPVRGRGWAHAGIVFACLLLAIHLLLFILSAHERRQLQIEKLVLQREAARNPEPFHYNIPHTQHQTSPSSPPVPAGYIPPPPPPVPAALSSKEMLGGERHPAHRSE